MFWDGSRWVRDASAASPARAPSRLTVWAATAIMVLGMAGVAVPLSVVVAANRPASGASIVLNQAAPVHYMTAAGGPSTNSGTASVNFSVIQLATDRPWVTVVCTGRQSYAVKSLVLYGQTLGYFASWPYGQTFTIGVGSSNKWIEPTKASCAAQLWWTDNGGTTHNLAKTSFVAEP